MKWTIFKVSNGIVFLLYNHFLSRAVARTDDVQASLRGGDALAVD